MMEGGRCVGGYMKEGGREVCWWVHDGGREGGVLVGT